MKKALLLTLVIFLFAGCQATPKEPPQSIPATSLLPDKPRNNLQKIKDASLPEESPVETASP
jgi:hypothetical protein